MTVNVTSVNDAPAAVASSVTTNEDTDRAFAAADFNYSDASDSPANGFQAAIVTSLPGNGSLRYNGSALTAGDLPKTVSAADLLAGKLVFRPAANGNGTPYTSFKFEVQDDGCSALCGQDRSPNEAPTPLTVNPVNDAPAAVASSVTTNEDTDRAFAAA